ncbi:MAG: Ig-like domain-containing protein [Anaerobutyricum sp.]
MNKTKTCTGLSALFAVLLAIMIAVPAILQSGANAAVNKKQPTKATLTSAKATSYNKVSLKWKKSKNITSYAVYYKASDSKKWVKVANVSSKKTGYTHKSSKKYPLKQGKTYQYRIRGYNKKAKGSKKWGKYSSIKKVNIPKKPAAKPTETPKPTAKPTEAPKPTVAPKPTTAPKPTAAPKPTVTPIPKPTAIPKPTTIPKPTAIPKPTEAPKPTAAPQPTKAPRPTATPKPTATPRPTATPAPTATPKPVKVSSITLNQTSLTMTSKGQTASLTATVNPGNAANKSITWSSSNSSVATVSANGTVTAVANGTADITATAADGSGVSAKCSVTVKVPNNVTTISLEGGKSKILSIWAEDYSDSINVNNVTFKYIGLNDNFEVIPTGSGNEWIGINIKAHRKGTVDIFAIHNGNTIKQWTVNVTSDWKEYLGYVSWKKAVENQIWTNNMTLKDKLDAAQNYIKTHFKYKNGAPEYIYAYSEGIADCFTASDFFGDFAKDAGAQVKYVSSHTGNMYDYIAHAVSDGGHVFNRVLLDGQWVNYDAQPPLS